MNIYCIYNDSSKISPKPIIVKQGFSFYASVLNFLWAIYHRMWILAILVIAFRILIAPFEKLAFYYIFDTSVLFIFGFFADDFRHYYASKSGLHLDEIIGASNEEEAELLYYKKLQNKEAYVR